MKPPSFLIERSKASMPMIALASAIIGASLLAIVYLGASEAQALVLQPMLVTVFVYALFCFSLSRKTRSGVVGEVGFIYVSFAVAYTILPAYGFINLDFKFPLDFDGLNFSILNPSPEELAKHLWRHNLFLAAVAISYLFARGKTTFSSGSNYNDSRQGQDLIIALFLALSSMLLINFFSAPVIEYFDHYTRFDHLPDLLQKTALFCMLIKTGAYYLTFVFLFRNYEKNKWFILFILIGVISFEIYYSMGSRIAALSILLVVICLYHINVRKISLGKATAYFLLLGIFFTLIEAFRSANYDLSAAIMEFSEKETKVAYEFGAVFYTSFHIYTERVNGNLPTPDILMLFGDFLDFIPFIDHKIYNSQFWYAAEYFPYAVVPPQTMGPIADSGIWGGEFDLFLRGLATGAFYGVFARWAAPRLRLPLVMLVYSYAYANCIMSLKYSFVHELSAMLKFLVPVTLIFLLLSWFSQAIITGFRRHRFS